MCVSMHRSDDDGMAALERLESVKARNCVQPTGLYTFLAPEPGKTSRFPVSRHSPDTLRQDHCESANMRGIPTRPSTFRDAHVRVSEHVACLRL